MSTSVKESLKYPITKFAKMRIESGSGESYYRIVWPNLTLDGSQTAFWDWDKSSIEMPVNCYQTKCSIEEPVKSTFTWDALWIRIRRSSIKDSKWQGILWICIHPFLLSLSEHFLWETNSEIIHEVRKYSVWEFDLGSWSWTGNSF